MPQLRKYLAVILAIAFSSFQVTLPTVVVAEDASPTPTASVSTTTSPSPTLPPRGPQGTIGPIEPVGPQGTVGVQSNPSPSSSPVASQLNTGTDGGTSATNTQTGANSLNDATVNQDTTTTVNQTNTATTNNNADISATTGNNSASFNTGNGTVNSGDVNGQLTVVNISNSQLGNGSTLASQSLNGDQTKNIALGTAAGTPLVSGNNQTGSNSGNVTAIDQNNLLQVNVRNDATVNNDLTVSADTGNNTASFNTGNGTVETGNINLALNVINLLNSFSPDIPVDLNILTVFGDLLADLLFPTSVANTNTGSNSTNSATVDSNNTLNIDTTNTADINNAFDYGLTTGNNTANDNTLGGSIQTGNVTAETAVTNIANSPAGMLWLVNVYGECECDLSLLDPTKYILNVIPQTIFAGNNQTGSNSDNTSTVNQNNETDINLTNNGTVNNNLKVTANTGGNAANDNTGTGSVKTGDINVATNLVNLVNSTAQAGQRFMLGVINILGNWSGKATISAKPTPTNKPSNNNAQANAQSAPQASANNSNNQTATTLASTATTQNTDARTAERSDSRAAIVPATSSNPSKTTGITKTKTTIDIKESINENNSDVKTTTTVDIQPSSSPKVETSTSVEDDSRGRGRTWFGTIAHAASKNGLIGSQQLPALAILGIPLLLWIISETAFGYINRRQNRKV